MVLVTGHLFHQERLTSIAVGATGLAETLVHKNLRSPETNQGDPSMSKSVETNTAAIYLS